MLFTFHVSSGPTHYVTQHEAKDWAGAKLALITSDAFRQFTQAALPATLSAAITDADVFLMVPMTGLRHCWLMQGGRAGDYFTAVIVQTDSTGEIEDPCDH